MRAGYMYRDYTKKVVRLWSDWSGLGCYSLHVGHDETGRGRSVGVFKTDMLAD